MSDNGERRKFRIDLIKREIIMAWERGIQTIDFKSLEANYCYKLGISKRSFKEYLDIALYLINGEIVNGQIKYKNGEQKQLPTV